MDDLIEEALCYFSQEHNRDEECKKCKRKSCEKKLLRELKKHNRAFIDCTDNEGAGFYVWSNALN